MESRTASAWSPSSSRVCAAPPNFSGPAHENPSWWSRRHRQDIGAALIEHAKQEAAARGIALVRIDCWAGQDGSLVRVYEAYGFSRVQEFTVALPAGPWPGMLLAMRVARDAIA